MNNQRRIAVVAVMLCLRTTAAWALAPACAGDCNRDGNVTVDEILQGVQIALNIAPVGTCTAFDTNRSSTVTVDEILAAVHDALTSCPPASPPGSPPPTCSSLTPSDGLESGCALPPNDLAPVGPQFHISPPYPSSPLAPAICRDATGGFAVVWSAHYDIFARRYASTGLAVSPEVQVNVDTAARFENPSICCAASGDFVVTWQDASREIVAQRFASTGAAIGTEFAVSTQAAGPIAACDSDGRFVVAWTAYSPHAILAQRFSDTGVPLGSALEIVSVNYNSHAAICAGDGGFVVVWNDYRGSERHIFGQRYDDQGVLHGSVFQVGGSRQSSAPTVTCNSAGDFVVVWADDLTSSVRGRHYDSAGDPQGVEFEIANPRPRSAPAACVDDDGGFAVLSSGTGGTFAQRYDAAGAPQGSNVQLSQFGQSPARAACDRDGNFVVVAAGAATAVGSQAVVGQCFNLVAPVFGRLAPCSGVGDEWIFDVQVGQEITVRVDTIDSESAADLCFRAECGPSSFRGDDQFACSAPPAHFACPTNAFVAQSDATCRLTVSTCSSVCTDATHADYALSVRLDGARVPIVLAAAAVPLTPSGPPKRTPTAIPTLTPTHTPRATPPACTPLDREGSGPTPGCGLPPNQPFATGPAFSVSSLSADEPVVCNDAEGKFVVAWRGTDASSSGIFAQRFASSGQPLGSEFQVNAYTTGTQGDPAVCCIADGRLVVVWSGEGTGSVNGVFGQRFQSDGTPSGSAFQVNSDTAPASYPNVACADDGDFVVVWRGDGIEGRRFTSAGAPAGSTFQVSPSSGDFFRPAIGNQAGHSVVVASGDNAGTVITAQRYDLGGPVGNQFQVNTYTSRAYRPAIATDAAGDFVVVWPGNRPALPDPPSGVVVHEREPNNTAAAANAVQIGDDFTGTILSTADVDVVSFLATAGTTILATSTPPLGLTLYDPRGQALFGDTKVGVRLFEDGRYVLQIRGTTGDYRLQLRSALPAFAGVLGRRFDSEGTALGKEFDVAQGDQPTVGSDAAGNFVVAWRNSEIFAQRFSSQGAALGGPFEVDQTELAFDGGHPAAASDANGNFVVVWSDGKIMARRYAFVPSVFGQLDGCPGRGDQWSFDLVVGAAVSVRADTVDAATAADLCVRIRCPNPGGVSGGHDYGGDDEFPCSYPPSSFACPEVTFTSPVTATCTVTVTTCSFVCTDAGRANYALTVVANGTAAGLVEGSSLPTTPDLGKMTPTPSITPTPLPSTAPTATPTLGSSVRSNLEVWSYQSQSEVYFVLLPPAGRRAQVTNVALASGALLAYQEPFDPRLLPRDLQLTSIAGALYSDATSTSQILDPGRVRRTQLLKLAVDPHRCQPQFDKFANGGNGVLTFASGEQVTVDGSTTSAGPVANVVLAEPTDDVPAAVLKTVTRYVPGISDGSVKLDTFAFPFPAPARCDASSANAGATCTADLECLSKCAHPTDGCCGSASHAPTCGGAPSQVCEPDDPSACNGGLVGPCVNTAAQVDGQNITLDALIGSPIGNPASQPNQPDGFRLEGACDSADRCTAIVFIAAAGSGAPHASAAGFLLDEHDVVIGTAVGEDQSGPSAAACPPP